MAKILIIEDEMYVRYLYSETLSNDYDVVEAEDGFDGLDLLEDEEFDLLIVDINMPAMDGIRLLEKARDLGIDIKAIIISAYGREKYADRLIELGVVEYFEKPVDIENLKKAVKKWC